MVRDLMGQPIEEINSNATGQRPVHFVPYVNRPDLLVECLKSIQGVTPIIVVDNRDNFSTEPDPREIAPARVHRWKTPIALSHSQMMTWLMLRCRDMGIDWFTWCHHDCIASPEAIGALRVLANGYNEHGVDWAVLLTRDPNKPEDGPWNHVDVLAAMRVAPVLAVGGYDWLRFPSVFSDYDLYGKLVKAGYMIVQTGIEIEHNQGGSTTVKSDPNRAEIQRETWTALQRLWDLRRTELGLTWPPP